VFKFKKTAKMSPMKAMEEIHKRMGFMSRVINNPDFNMDAYSFLMRMGLRSGDVNSRGAVVMLTVGIRRYKDLCLMYEGAMQMVADAINKSSQDFPATRLIAEEFNKICEMAKHDAALIAKDGEAAAMTDALEFLKFLATPEGKESLKQSLGA
jgi:hypothetical protein